MPESVLISLGETPLRRRTRRKSLPSGRVGDALDLAAGHFLDLLNQLAVVEHAVDRLLDEFEDQGLLLFAHVASWMVSLALSLNMSYVMHCITLRNREMLE